MLNRNEIETLMRAGAEAFERGMESDVCPHRMFTAEFGCWLRGYQNAAFGAAHQEKHHV